MPDMPPPPLKSTKSTTTASDASKGMTLFVMIVATLYFGKEVLVPVTLALLLAFILAPLVEVLRRFYLGRVISVLLGVFLAISIISGIGGVIGSQLGELSDELPNYVGTVEEKIATVKHYTIGQLSRLADSVGQHREGLPSLPLSVPTDQTPTTKTTHTAAPKEIPDAATPLALAERYLSPVLAPLATLGIVFIVAVFALLQREDLRDRLIRLIGSEDLHQTTLAIDDAARRLSKYFVTQLFINTLFGVVIGIGLLIIGVPNPVLWGILSTLLRFVPYVGSLISAVLPLMLAAAVQPEWGMVFSTAILFVVAEGITGQVVEPFVYGRSTGLSPFSVVVAALFWSWLWGPIGLILSTPLTLCLVVMGRHIKRLEFLDIMLGDRPALTPVESFYQRVLSGDADEAQDHAERLLKDRSLSTYYDEVAVKGMQLAVNDARRELLDDQQLDRIKSTVKLLIRGFDKYNDKQPHNLKTDEGPVAIIDGENLPRNPDPKSLTTANEQQLPEDWKSSSAILCIAGRGPLDELAAMMLAQLLGKHGLKGRVVNYTEVSREQIDTLDVTGVAMVCVSYVDITGNPAHLRYLMQRLRQKLPKGVPVLVGIWPIDDVTLFDKEIKATIDADYFISSLEKAVTTCIAAAQKASL